MVRTIRHLALAAGAGVLLVAAACGRTRPAGLGTYGSRVAQGLTFTIRTVTSSGTSFGAGSSRTDSITTRCLDGVLRFDFPAASDRRAEQGALPGVYLLVDIGARTTTVVMPRWKQYWETRFDSAAAPRAQSKTVVSDIDVAGSSVGSGETINGHATRRYRISTRYIETPLDDSKGGRPKQVDLVEDVWVSDALNDVPDPMQAFTRDFASLGARSRTTGELAEKRAAARRKLFRGLPIRTTSVLTKTHLDGAKEFTASTTDILDVKRTDLDPAAFRVPDGYGRIDFAALMSAFDRLLNGARDTTKGWQPGARRPER